MSQTFNTNLQSNLTLLSVKKGKKKIDFRKQSKTDYPFSLQNHDKKTDIIEKDNRLLT